MEDVVLDAFDRQLVDRNIDTHRFAQVLRGGLGDLVGKRGREQHRLSFGWALPQDVGDFVPEAHRQHLVGFVENDGLQAAEHEILTTDMIEKTARRTDDDVDAAAQRYDLASHRHAAVDRVNAQAFLGADGTQLLGDLVSELARWREHEGARLVGLARHLGHAVQQRHTEGGGLARAGAGLDHEVFALHRRLNHRRLHVGRQRVAETGDSGLDLVADGEGNKGD